MNKHAADHRSYEITLPVATAHRETWETPDLEYLAAHEADRDEDIALALGRTIYAVRGVRSTLDIKREQVRVRNALKPREVTFTSWAEWEASFE